MPLEWDTQLEWADYSSKDANVIVDNGVVTLDPSAVDPMTKAIHQWKFDEGSGSTAADSVGNMDGSINGASWVSSSDAVGGYWIEGDGSSDNIQIDFQDLTSFMTNDFAIAFTLDKSTTLSSDTALMGCSGGDGNFIVYLNHSFQNTDNSVELVMQDSNGNSYVTRAPSGTLDTSSGLSRVVINKSGHTGSSGVDYYLDGSQVTTTVEVDQGFDTGSVSNIKSNFCLLARYHAGPIHHSGIPTDNIVLFDDTLTSDEIQADYNNQPWS